MTTRTTRLFLLSAAAAAALLCPWLQPSPALAAGDPAVEALAKEVGARGWILFGAHPQEIDSGKIIAPVDQRGQMDLYLARPDGSLLRNITNTPDFNEYGGRFSPDGRKILYRRLPKDRKVNHDLWGQFGELILADADGANPVVKGKEGELPWATWSPDGKQVACLYKKEGVIRIHDLADGKSVRVIPRQGIFQQLVWSPDGKSLVGTANVAGQQWNIVAVNLASQKLTLLSRELNCTPDWFQKDSTRVIYSNRTPGITPRLGPQVNDYGFTVLMQAKADGSSRTLVYGRLNKHAYFGCTSPDDKYAIFGDDPQDGLIVGEMHVVRLADTPIVAPAPPFPELKERYPNAKAGPVLDLKLPGGEPLRGFEPHWTAREIPAKR